MVSAGLKNGSQRVSESSDCVSVSSEYMQYWACWCFWFSYINDITGTYLLNLDFADDHILHHSYTIKTEQDSFLLQKNLDMFYLSGQLSGRWGLTPVDVLIWRSQNFIAILTVAHKHLHLGFTLDDHLDSIYPYHKNNKKDYKKLMLNFIKRHFRL